MNELNIKATRAMRTFSIALFTLAACLVFLPFYAIFRVPRFFFSAAKFWAKGVILLSGSSMTIVNRSLLTSHQCIIAANHSSIFDIPILLALLQPNVVILYKKELHAVPIFGWLIALSPFIAVDRKVNIQSARSLDIAITAINRGCSILIFPEGTWSNPMSILPFKRGFVSLSQTTSLPILPIAIYGAHEIVPPDQYLVKSGEIVVTVCEPEYLESVAEYSDKEIGERIRTVIQSYLIRAPLSNDKR